jgi:large subunit ribosomal protein L24
MTMKIHKNDMVVVVKGKDRGKKGKVTKVLPDFALLLVEGVNIRKKHQRARGGQKGQVINYPSPIAVANIKIVCGKCGKSVRVKYQKSGDEKFRICSSCKEKL